MLAAEPDADDDEALHYVTQFSSVVLPALAAVAAVPTRASVCETETGERSLASAAATVCAHVICYD